MKSIQGSRKPTKSPVFTDKRMILQSIPMKMIANHNFLFEKKFDTLLNDTVIQFIFSCYLIILFLIHPCIDTP